LQQRIDHYRAHKTDTCEAIEDLDDLGKLGQGFTSDDPLEEVDIGDGIVPRPTFVNKNLNPMFELELIKIWKSMLIALLGIIMKCLVSVVIWSNINYLLNLVSSLINSLVGILILILMTK
jgi:hypothetical protein